MSVSGSPVCVATELAVVAQPRVGAFDDPAQPESKRLFNQARVTPLGAPLDVEILEAAIGQLGTNLG